MNRFPDLDPYEVLGLSRGCTSTEIKAAYKKLALKNHPDRAPPAEKEEATARFKIVGEAYELLSDDRKRRDYDLYGPGRGSSSGFAPPGPEYEDDFTRKHFGTSPNGVPFNFVWESSADSARRAQAGRRAGRPFGADGFDPFELFNMMFKNEFGSAGPGGRMGGGAQMGGGIFGDQDPFMQNHRRMADTMGFGFGSPFMQPPMAPSQGAGLPGRFSNFSSSTSTSTTTMHGGFSGSSGSITSRTVNGRTETVTRKVDSDGNVTVHTMTPEGSTVSVNGVQQANHPLLGNAAPQAQPPLQHAQPPLPYQPAASGSAGYGNGTANNPIVVDDYEGPAPAIPGAHWR